MDHFYKHELSKIHDRYFSDLAIHAAQEVLRLIHNVDYNSQTVIDLGCGSGRLASILTKKDLHVIGVDFSDDMLSLARKNAPKAYFLKSSLFDFDFPASGFVTAIGESINYLFDNKSSYETISDLVERIYQSLSKNGVFLFDILTTEVKKSPGCKIFEKDDITMIVEIEVDQASSILKREITLVCKQQDCYVKEKEVHKQFLVEKTKLAKILTEQGFTIQEIDNYNGLKFRQGRTGFICKK